jgi:VanZ family protein
MLPKDDSSPRAGWGRRWAPVVAYVVLVFAVSSVPRLRPPSPWVGADKAAHTIEYGVLGLLLRRALDGREHAGLAAVVFAGVVGGLDEVYQTTVPGRFPSLLDWGADLAGGALGVLLQPLVAGLWPGRPGNPGGGDKDGKGRMGRERGQG